MSYLNDIDALISASGVVETDINGNGGNPPSQGQSDFLNFLQGPLKNAAATAKSDPNIPAGV